MIKHNLNNKLKDYKFIDLFAGIGGFHLALSSFGAKCIFASEWDKEAQKIYEYNYKIKPYGDITQIHEDKIPQHDILCAGFPCQDFSISGKQKGFKDSRGTLFFDVARIAKKHQPKLIFLENVKNFERHDDGNTLKTVLKTLEEIGYKTHYKILNASDFNIPQKRERIYLVAIRNDLKTKFNFPTGTKELVTLESFLGDNEENLEKVKINKPINWNGKKEDEFIPNKTNRLGTYSKGGQGERVYSPKGHAITLSAYGGGIGAKTGLYKVGDTVRKLTPKECARISGFPERFTIASNSNVAYKQFGNTVVVNVLQAITENIIKQEVL